MATYMRAAKVAVRFRRVLWHGRAFFEDERNAPEFRRLLVENGPVFIKMGQWMCQRPDVFPRAFLCHLESLQREAPSHSFAETRRIVEAELSDENATLESTFERFEPQHLASGSIAQVHEVVYQGRRAIAKVRHPNIVQRVRDDLALLRAFVMLGRAANVHYCRVLDIDRVMNEMLAQCDMRHERRCLDDMAQNFADNPLVHFPEPLLATEALLVETFVDGLDYGLIGDPEHDPFAYRSDDERDTARLLCKQVTMACFFQMILHDALLHADLHRGNMLYRIERHPEDDRLVAHLSLLDFGIVVHLNDLQKGSIHEFIVGLYASNPKGVVDALAKVTMQNNTALAQRRFAAFADDTDTVVRGVTSKLEEEGAVEIPDVMQQILRLLYRHRLLIDGNVIRVMVDFVLISEGRANELYNNLTDDTINWVLYGDDGQHFPIVEHLLEIPLTDFNRQLANAGRGEARVELQSGLAQNSISASRRARYAKVDSLATAKNMRGQTLAEAGSVRVHKQRRRRIVQSS